MNFPVKKRIKFTTVHFNRIIEVDYVKCQVTEGTFKAESLRMETLLALARTTTKL